MSNLKLLSILVPMDTRYRLEVVMQVPRVLGHTIGLITPLDLTVRLLRQPVKMFSDS